jgi:hypothetical protein
MERLRALCREGRAPVPVGTHRGERVGIATWPDRGWVERRRVKEGGFARGSAHRAEAQVEAVAASQPREKGAFGVTADPGYGDGVVAVRLKARERGASVARREDWRSAIVIRRPR